MAKIDSGFHSSCKEIGSCYSVRTCKKAEQTKTSTTLLGSVSIGVAATFLWILPLRADQVFTVNILENPPTVSSRGRGKRNIWNRPEHSALFNKACLQGKLVNQILTYWDIIRVYLTLDKRNTQFQPTPAILSHLSWAGGRYVGRFRKLRKLWSS